MLFLIVGVIFITIALVSFGRKREGKNENDGIAKPPQLVDAASHRAKGGENLSLKVRGETPHPRVEEVLQLPQTNQHNNMKKDNRWKDFNYPKYNYLRNKGANRNIGDEIEFAVLEKEKALMEGNAEDAIRAEKRYRALNKRWFTYIAWRFLPPIALIGICYLLYKLGVLK